MTSSHSTAANPGDVAFSRPECGSSGILPREDIGRRGPRHRQRRGAPAARSQATVTRVSATDRVTWRTASVASGRYHRGRASLGGTHRPTLRVRQETRRTSASSVGLHLAEVARGRRGVERGWEAIGGEHGDGDEHGDARRRRGIARGERAARTDHHPRSMCRRMEEPRASGDDEERGGGRCGRPLSRESRPPRHLRLPDAEIHGEVLPVPLPGVRLGGPRRGGPPEGQLHHRAGHGQQREHPARGRPSLGAVRAAAGRVGGPRRPRRPRRHHQLHRQDTDPVPEARQPPRARSDSAPPEGTAVGAR